MITHGDTGITGSPEASGYGNHLPAPPPGAGGAPGPGKIEDTAEGAEAPQDLMMGQDLEQKQRMAAELGEKIDTLHSGIKHHVDRSGTLQKYINRTILGAFCPTTMAVIFAPVIAAGLGFPALAPILQNTFMGLFLSEAAVAGGLKFAQHRHDKAITPMVRDVENLTKEKARIEKDYRNIKEMKDLDAGLKAEQSAIVEEDDYIMIEGLKLKKKKFNLFQSMYTLEKQEEQP